MKLFEPITVKLDDLLLDPNNPRLVRTPNEGTIISDADIEGLQDQILAQFDPEGRPDHISTKDLDDSMRQLGYVGIDQLVVRKLKGSDKFVVVEGNRRVSTLKRLVQEYEEALTQEITDKVVSTFRELKVMRLSTDDISEAEIRHRLSVILGLRHHGSLLEWEPLPKAHNIYVHYMDLQRNENHFLWEPAKGKEIASMLSIKPGDVRRSLRTYVAYLQLNERTKIRSEYYSLIQSAVTNRNLTAYGYFKVDSATFRLDRASFERMLNICQFTKRHLLPPSKIIISRPQLFAQLGRILESAHRAKQHAVRTLAAALLADVESGELDDSDALKTTVEGAWAELKAFESRLEWVSSLTELLERQEHELPFDTYHGEGNDRLAKDQLMTLLSRFRAILGLEKV